MFRSLKLGSAFGIGIFIHWTFWLLPLWVLLTAANIGDLGPGFYLVLLASVFGCVILHELGHALAARHFGIGTRDITIYPIGGVARLERMSEKPTEELWIALAGPAVNVVIALALLAVMLAGVAFDPRLALQSIGGQFLQYLLVTNVMLVLFNLLPAFPMDGGRVFRAILALFLGQLRATRIAAAVAVGVAVLMGLFGVVSQHFPLLLVAVFVYFAGQAELRSVEMRERLRWEEPLEVLPVRPAAPVALDLQPTVSVYTWDNATGSWIKQPSIRPVQVHYGSTS